MRWTTRSSARRAAPASPGAAETVLLAQATVQPARSAYLDDRVNHRRLCGRAAPRVPPALT